MDIHYPYIASQPPDKRWQKTVDVVEPGQLSEGGFGEQFQPTTGIRYSIPENRIANTVGQS